MQPSSINITQFSKQEFIKELEPKFNISISQLDLFQLNSDEQTGFFGFSQVDLMTACFFDITSKNQPISLNFLPEYASESIRIILNEESLVLSSMVDKISVNFEGGDSQEFILCVCPKETLFLELSTEEKVKFIDRMSIAIPLSNLLKNTFNELRLAIKLKNGLFSLLFKSFLLQIAFEIASKTKSSKVENPNKLKFDTIYDILESNLLGGFPPTIPSMAKELGISVSKLKYIFNQYTGMGIYNFYFKKKMELAHQLLASGQHNVSEVSSMLGYSTPTKFIVAYKKIHGLSPRKHTHQ